MQLYKINGTQYNMSVLYDSEKGNVSFDFVSKDEEKNHIFVIQDAVDMGLFARDINDGAIGRSLKAEKDSATADKRNAGQVYSLSSNSTALRLIPSLNTKADLIIQADNGEQQMNVACRYRELRKIAFIWSYVERDAMSHFFKKDTKEAVSGQKTDTETITEFVSATVINKYKDKGYYFQTQDKQFVLIPETVIDALPDEKGIALLSDTKDGTHIKGTSKTVKGQKGDTYIQMTEIK